MVSGYASRCGLTIHVMNMKGFNDEKKPLPYLPGMVYG
ncbi:hypothetical protein BN137_4194 [Cronobacter condimenti 1330]|uniref:Uncharacterized protein n=1 Tax=Cronobacter condimenti 1330 TaxID=1073999 RepID=K8A3X8_9ENTR|nr:hypothetical protein BN137_4194 [Cronobacter condimenti 1330]